MLFRKYNS